MFIEREKKALKVIGSWTRRTKNGYRYLLTCCPGQLSLITVKNYLFSIIIIILMTVFVISSYWNELKRSMYIASAALIIDVIKAVLCQISTSKLFRFLVDELFALKKTNFLKQFFSIFVSFFSILIDQCISRNWYMLWVTEI